MADSLKVYEFENTGRDVLVFPVVTFEGKDKKPKVVRRLVLGDKQDRLHALEGQGGERDEVLQPNPIQRWTSADLDAIGPHGREVLEHYVNTGVVRRREVAA